MKPLFTGDAIKAELLAVMLEKHGITAHADFVRKTMSDVEDEFTRETTVFVSSEDYERANRLFMTDREDEL